jgi:uncharacterized protein YndB with AHSA1/START domain
MGPTDRIEKSVVLKAPLERVWRAISDAGAFGSWFGMKFDGPFVPQSRLRGRIAPTQVDPEVAKLQEPHAGIPFELQMERIEPMSLLSFRWHPGAIDPKIDYTREPTTLVEFRLEPAAQGTLLTITESGFDGIPLERRARVFAGNEAGWTHQLRLIEKYLRQGDSARTGASA